VEKDPQKDFRHINKDEQTEQSKSPSGNIRAILLAIYKR
jgi:hypothetical protein